MSYKLTYFANIEKKYLYGFYKKLIGITNSFTNSGIKSQINISENLNFFSFIDFIFEIIKCKTKYIFIRSFGYRTPILLPIIIFLRLKRKIIILDIPTPFKTFLLEKKKSKNNFVISLYTFFLVIFGPITLRSANLVIQYDIEGFPFTLFGTSNFFLTSNGTDVKNYNHKKNKQNLYNNQLNLLFVGSAAFWHGLDNCIHAIHKYQINNTIKIKLHIVGYVEENLYFSLKKLILKYNIKSQVIFHGILKGKELEKIYYLSNIGLGSVGLKKINGKYRSELKAREYCAVGLPFIASSVDKDFPNDINFRYVVKNEENINFKEIIKWYTELPNDIPTIMHKYAFDNLDYNIKAREIFNRINTC